MDWWVLWKGDDLALILYPKHNCKLNTTIFDIIDHDTHMGHPKFKNRFNVSLSNFDIGFGQWFPILLSLSNVGSLLLCNFYHYLSWTMPSFCVIPRLKDTVWWRIAEGKPKLIFCGQHHELVFGCLYKTLSMLFWLQNGVPISSAIVERRRNYLFNIVAVEIFAGLAAINTSTFSINPIFAKFEPAGNSITIAWS